MRFSMLSIVGCGYILFRYYRRQNGYMDFSMKLVAILAMFELGLALTRLPGNNIVVKMLAAGMNQTSAGCYLQAISMDFFAFSCKT